MAEHYILCVLSTISLKQGDTLPLEMDVAESRRETFSDHRKLRNYSGFQTNEAPVKCLIDMALRCDNPVTKILCLTSPECKNPVVKNGTEELSAKDWFERSIQDFYREKNYSDIDNPAKQDEFFVHLPYSGTNPSENLQALIKELDRQDALIDIDTTGGPRDAAFLLTTIVQFIKAKYGTAIPQGCDAAQRIGLGTTVYANLQQRAIHTQNETFAINELIHAISSFTKYGKADPLVSYFERDTTGTATSDEMKKLCAAMKKFADDLSLCRTQGINDSVNRIHTALNGFEKATKRKSSQHQMILDFINELDSDAGIDGLKDRISTGLDVQQEDAREWLDRSLRECATKEELLDFLRRENKGYLVRRGEILFLTLADNLRSDIPSYVGDGACEEERATQTIEIIRWCVRRGMLQQALALFKERVPECLAQKGMIGWGNRPTRYNDRMVDRVTQLSHFSQARLDHNDALARDRVGRLASILEPNARGGSRRAIEQVLCAARPDIAANGTHIVVEDGTHLPAALIWFRIINSIRNDVMHVHEGGYWDVHDFYLPACKGFFQDASQIDCGYDETPATLEKAFEMALKAVEGSVTLECSPYIVNLLASATAKKFLCMQAPAGTVDEVLQDIRGKLSQDGYAFIVAEDGEGWKSYNAAIDGAQDLEFSRAVVVSKHEGRGSTLPEGVDQDILDLCEAARKAILSAGREQRSLFHGSTEDESQYFVFWDDILSRDPFNDDQKRKKLKNLSSEKGSILVKLAKHFPDDFEAVRCIRLSAEVAQ